MPLPSIESSDDFGEINCLFQEIDRDFSLAEAKIKKVERLGEGLAFPPVNELRYCAFHFNRAFKSDSEEFIKNELREAKYHCQRAIHDSIEIEILHYLQKLKKFQNDYNTITVTDVLSNYVDLLELAERAKDLIIKRSENSVTEHSHTEHYEHSHSREDASYTDADALLEELRSNDKLLSRARIELNKKLRQQNEEIKQRRRSSVRWLIGLTVAIAGVAVATLGIFLSQLFGCPLPPTP